MLVDQTVKGLMLKALDTLDKGALDVIHARRQELADIFFDKGTPVAKKQDLFEELNAIHKYLGMKTLFQPKEKKSAAAAPSKPIRTPEQRKEDSVKMIEDLWPEAVRLSKVQYPIPKDNQKDNDVLGRHILAQVFLYNMTELYKQ